MHKAINSKNTLLKSMYSSGIGYLKRNAGILIGLIALCVIISINSPIFLTQKNLMNVLRQISNNLYLASGMTIILIAGGIDLSVGSNIAVIGVMAGTLLNMGVPIPLVILACLVTGVVIGTINGAIIANTTLPPFIVTFAMLSILRGFAYVYTGGTTVRIDNKAYIAIGTGYLGFIPLPVVYLIVVLLIVYLILNKSRLGRHIYAVGGNEKAAAFSGINIRRIRMFIYIFSGVMAALAGIVLSARSYSGNPVAGDGAEMDAIAAVVLGGTSMLGGYGYIGGTIIGALIIGILSNGLNLMGIDSFWQIILKGIVILVAVYVDYVKNRKKNKT
ncbi:ABC transporter permease [Acetanaerobacterium elongatum]